MRTSNLALWRRLENVSCEVFTAVAEGYVCLNCHIAWVGNQKLAFWRSVLSLSSGVITCWKTYWPWIMKAVFLFEISGFQDWKMFLCAIIFFMYWLVLFRWPSIVLSLLTAYYFYCMKIGLVSRASSLWFLSPPFTCSLHSVKLLNNFKVFILDIALSP